MDGADDRFEKHRPQCRFGVRACVYGLILAWALFSILKWADWTPAYLARAGILAGPAMLFVAIGCYFAFVLRRRRRMAHLPVPLLRCAAMLFRIEAERGYSKLGTVGGPIWGSWIGAWKDAASPAHGSTSGRAIPPAIPTFPLVDGRPFLLEMGGAIGSNREHGGDGDCSLLLPIAPNNAKSLLLFAPYCSLASGAAFLSHKPLDSGRRLSLEGVRCARWRQCSRSLLIRSEPARHAG
jgi:hypothetical protein